MHLNKQTNKQTNEIHSWLFPFLCVFLFVVERTHRQMRLTVTSLPERVGEELRGRGSRRRRHGEERFADARSSILAQYLVAFVLDSGHRLGG